MDDQCLITSLVHDNTKLSNIVVKLFFSRSSSTASEPNFKYLCNSIPGTLNVFEALAQHV